MSKVIVLGAGMIGSAIAIDLSKNHTVTLTDVNQTTLEKHLNLKIVIKGSTVKI